MDRENDRFLTTEPSDELLDWQTLLAERDTKLDIEDITETIWEEVQRIDTLFYPAVAFRYQGNLVRLWTQYTVGAYA